jgi:hypothetical protein
MPDRPTALDDFRNIVLADPALQDELRHAPDRASFTALVLERAGAHGCALERGEIEAALAGAAHDWMLRRVR